MKQLFILSCLLLLSPALAHAQVPLPTKASLSFVNQSFGLSSPHVFKGSLHPGIAATLVFDRVKAPKSNQQWAIDLGCFYHDHFQTGAFLLGGIDFKNGQNNKINLSWGPRAGYLHSFYPTGVYEFNGTGYQIKKGGRANMMLGINGRLGYQPISALPIELFVSVTPTLDGPFAIYYGVPVAPRVLSRLGITYTIKKS